MRIYNMLTMLPINAPAIVTGARTVVLILVGVTEPHRFHMCVHRTLLYWKIK